MLTLEQFSHLKQHSDYFNSILSVANKAADKLSAEKVFRNACTLETIRKLAKRERDYNKVGYDTYTAKEFMELQQLFIKKLGSSPSVEDIEAFFKDAERSKLEEQSEKFIFLEE